MGFKGNGGNEVFICTSEFNGGIYYFVKRSEICSRVSKDYRQLISNQGLVVSWIYHKTPTIAAVVRAIVVYSLNLFKLHLCMCIQDIVCIVCRVYKTIFATKL